MTIKLLRVGNSQRQKTKIHTKAKAKAMSTSSCRRRLARSDIMYVLIHLILLEEVSGVPAQMLGLDRVGEREREKERER